MGGNPNKSACRLRIDQTIISPPGHHNVQKKAIEHESCPRAVEDRLVFFYYISQPCSYLISDFFSEDIFRKIFYTVFYE